MNKSYYKNRLQKQHGLTLIEIMIAMLLGLILLLGITGLFMSNKRVYKEQEYMSRMQENARFAMETLIHDIRMAGYVGCSDDISKVNNFLNGGTSDTSAYSFANAVEGSESKSNWQPSGSTDIVSIASGDPTAMVAGTDGISIRYLDPLGIKLDKNMPQSSAVLEVTSIGNLVQGSIIAVSDCDSADIMQLFSTNGSSLQLVHNTNPGLTPGNANSPFGPPTNNLSKRYSKGAQIVSFVSRRYYIGEGSGNGPSLYRVDNGGTPQELIEGVEQMQLLYGVDTDGNKTADTYLNATAVTAASAWDTVVSVRLSLLFRTVQQNNQIEPDNQTRYLLGGTPGSPDALHSDGGGVTVAAANDYNRRRVFTTTVQIRNRGN